MSPRKLAHAALAALALALPGAAPAAETGHVEDIDFPWEGPFGSFDQFQLQRGLHIHTEVCANCHGLKFVPIRTLADPGGPALPIEQVRAYATRFQVFDPEIGDLRPGIPSDHFPASGTIGAPDLSLITKARAGFHGPYATGINQFFRGQGGPEYVAAILTGYTGEEKVEAGVTLYANTAFPGGWIAMAPPLADGQIEHADGHANTVRHMSEDVAAFLTWTAEPKMMARKQAGFLAVFTLIFLSVLLYLTNKRLWAPHKGKPAAQVRG